MFFFVMVLQNQWEINILVAKKYLSTVEPIYNELPPNKIVRYNEANVHIIRIVTI